MKAILFGSAEIKKYDICRQYIEKNDVIICCDGGVKHTKELGVMPHYILGDFDSASHDILSFYQDNGVEIKQFPTHKDETDMELGLNFAMELGIEDIVIFGGIGCRFDHTLANAHLLLRLLKRNIRGRLVNENNCIELIDKSTIIYGKKGDLVSVIPLSMQVIGVTLTGLAYPLYEKTLTIDDDLVAVSNIMISEQAEIQIKKGFLFVIQSKD